MKKLLAILLAAMMVFALAACDTGDDPNPSGSNNPGTSQNDTPGGTENQGGENNNGGENSGNGAQTTEDTFETRMTEVGLPGLAMPEGCAYEQAKSSVFKGAKLTKETSWTSDDLKAFIRSAWTRCSELTNAGIFDGTFGGGKFTVEKTYDSILDKYPEFDTTELDGCEITWNYTYDGNVYQLKISHASKSENVAIYTYNTNTVVE